MQTSRDRSIGAAGFLWFHGVLALLMLAMAVQLHVSTLRRIRAFQPRYPTLVVLALYTPIEIVRPLHIAGPFILSTLTAAALSISVVTVIRRSRPTAFNLAVAGLNLVLLLGAIYTYALAAVQLAGVAALMARPGS